MKHAAEFDAYPVIGKAASGVSRGTTHGGRRTYETRWSGVYEGVRPSEWTGEPVHCFGAGIIGETPQGCFAIPVAQVIREPASAEEEALFCWGHQDCAGSFAFYERLPAATVYACVTCGQHRVAQDDPEVHGRAMSWLADSLIGAADA